MKRNENKKINWLETAFNCPMANVECVVCALCENDLMVPKLSTHMDHIIFRWTNDCEKKHNKNASANKKKLDWYEMHKPRHRHINYKVKLAAEITFSSVLWLIGLMYSIKFLDFFSFISFDFHRSLSSSHIFFSCFCSIVMRFKRELKLTNGKKNLLFLD